MGTLLVVGLRKPRKAMHHHRGVLRAVGEFAGLGTDKLVNPVASEDRAPTPRIHAVPHLFHNDEEPRNESRSYSRTTPAGSRCQQGLGGQSSPKTHVAEIGQHQRQQSEQLLMPKTSRPKTNPLETGAEGTGAEVAGARRSAQRASRQRHDQPR